MSLTDTAETRVLDWVNGEGAAPTRPTAPLMCRLMTANGSDSAAGTEVTGNAYTPQDANLGAASGNAVTNGSDITFSSLDSGASKVIVGIELWDSAGTPVRIWWGALAASKTVNAGDPFVIPAGDLDLTLS